MAVTYGHTDRGTQDPFLSRAQELLDIARQLLSPERAAMFTAFPFREYVNAIDDVDLNTWHVGCSQKAASLVLPWSLCPDGTQ
jgi:hypothetical protein